MTDAVPTAPPSTHKKLALRMPNPFPTAAPLRSFLFHLWRASAEVSTHFASHFGKRPGPSAQRIASSPPFPSLSPRLFFQGHNPLGMQQGGREGCIDISQGSADVARPKPPTPCPALPTQPSRAVCLGGIEGAGHGLRAGVSSQGLFPFLHAHQTLLPEKILQIIHQSLWPNR
jgi:hypothetical protein